MIGAPTPPPSESGLGAAAVTVIAVVTLLLGGVCGFFVGRAVESDDQTTSAAPPLTSPSSSSTTRPPGDTVPQSPPGEQTPPSTDLEPSTIGTIEDPIPAGQAYVLGLYEVQVLGANLDATDEVVAASPSNPAPPEGSQHVLVEVAIRYNEREGVGNPVELPFFVSDGTGEWRDFEASCGAYPDPVALSGLIEAGDEAVGNVCFTVPSDAVDALMLATEGFDGPVYFALP